MLESRLSSFWYQITISTVKYWNIPKTNRLHLSHAIECKNLDSLEFFSSRLMEVYGLSPGLRQKIHNFTWTVFSFYMVATDYVEIKLKIVFFILLWSKTIKIFLHNVWGPYGCQPSSMCHYCRKSCVSIAGHILACLMHTTAWVLAVHIERRMVNATSMKIHCSRASIKHRTNQYWINRWCGSQCT